MRASGRLQLFRPKKEPLGLENESFWKGLFRPQKESLES
ncbi:uncharacterized protein G2W53_008155 [Senna tora]|uniref:Uncharacterized protein n=1 Tax=Senna tora TaxID=362788 RepID=A0A834X877_9FABA|nr:uncharacterized protein G2W53_008155 [Senna tora]